MMKHVLMISPGLRGCSNSELPAEEVSKGADEAGNRGEQVSL